MSNSEWGAIPRSLANDVSNMIEKKMGTSSGYKPVEWVSQINLMGKLPVKSASGAIASFADGADGVPVKSCSVSFVASGGGGTPQNPISVQGVSGLSVTRTGANLLKNEIEDGMTGGIDYSLNSDGSISCSGTVSNVNSTRVIKTGVHLPVGSYFLSGADTSINLRCTIYAKDGTSTNRNDTGSGVTVSVTADTDYLEFRIKARTNAEVVNTTIYPMFEVGSIASTYSKYNASVVTDTFGQTIYGGTRDLTTDKASVTYALLELAVADMNNSDNYPGWRDCGIKALGLETQFYNEKTNVGQGYSVNTTGSNDILFLPKNSYNNMTQTQWQTNYPDLVIQIAVPLATPTEITGLTPHEIDTLYGDNNIYADTGTTEVEYRADIDLALNA